MRRGLIVGFVFLAVALLGAYELSGLILTNDVISLSLVGMACVAGAFVLAHLVDEFVLYVAPALLGADAAPLMHVSGLGPPGSLPTFDYKDVRQIGGDLRLVLVPKRA